METTTLKEYTQLVAHNNPFDAEDITIIPVESGVSCYQLLKDFDYDIEYYDIIIARNQEVLDVDFIVEDQDIISFSLVPKGGGGGGNKGVVQIIVGIALIAVGVLAPLPPPIKAGLISAGIGMIIGGTVSLLFPPVRPSMPSISDSYSQSTTYGWNVQGNQIAQGYPVPILYGTMKVTPQYIGKYLETTGSIQVLKVLLSIGEGPFDNISEVLINDATPNTYSNTYFSTRLGTNNQTIIPDFNDTWADQGVNKKLTDTTTWAYSQTSGDAVTSFGVGIVNPQGLYYANDAGGLDSYSVYVDIEYSVFGSGIWNNILTSGYMVDTMFYYVDRNPVTANRTNFGYYWYSSALYADSVGPFDVYAVQIVGKGSAAPGATPVFIETVSVLPSDISGQASFMGQMAWVATRRYSPTSYFTISGAQASTIRHTFTATNLPPNKYEVRVKYVSAPSTSSRYASATYFEFLQEAVSDDFTYPNTGLLAISMQATDQLSGSLPKINCTASRVSGTYGRLDNPAWACLDLLMNNRYGANIPLSRINIDAFTAWASYCTTENFTVNIYLDQSLTLIQNLQIISQLGRGRVIQYGSSFSVLVDKPNLLPVQGFLFSMGNIIESSFSETFLPLKDRANIIEMTYYDIENGYDRTVIEVSQGNYDITNKVNKTQLDLLGCINKTQALRQAKYHLNQNKYLTITASWEASIDSIHCKIGDIVNVAHDVPQWGYSGRILGNTTNTITVDRSDLVLEVGKTFYLQVSDSNTDDQIYVPITSITGSTLTTTSTLGVIGDYSVYSFGEVNRHAKKMRILSISTSGDLKRKISAVEYNEDVYNDLVPVQAPVQVQDLRTKDLIVSEYMRVSIGGSITTVVQLSWKGAALNYNVNYKLASSNAWISSGTARSTTFEIENLTDGELYDFMVDGLVVQYRVSGQTTPPPDIINLTGSEFANTYTLRWDYPYKPVDFSRFDIYSNGVLLGSSITNTFSDYISTIKPITFAVVAVDLTGNTSVPQSVTIQVQGLGQVVNLKSYYINEYTKMVWDRVVDPRQPIDYEIRMGTIWDAGFILGRTAIPEYIISSNGNYMVKAHYTYPDGTELFSATETQLTITGAVLPKNIVATFDEKATGWLGTKTNVYVNADGNLELMSENIDTIPIIDAELVFDYAGGIKPSGIYEIPAAHIVDIGTAQVCRLWVDYVAEGRIVTDRVDSIFNFDTWVSVDGRSSDYILRPQIAIAQDNGIFGAWEDFIVGEYIGRKFKFRGVFYSLSPDTTCILSRAIFFVDMPDKLQSANSVIVTPTGVSVVYPIPFQVPPNVQITITNAVDGDDAILTNETATGFTLVIRNAGAPVTRSINWLAKGY